MTTQPKPWEHYAQANLSLQNNLQQVQVNFRQQTGVEMRDVAIRFELTEGGPIPRIECLYALPEGV